MGLIDVDVVNETMNAGDAPEKGVVTGRSYAGGFIVTSAACLVFCLNAISPPRLMDDVDAVQAQIARTMLETGDWVTARLDGVAYLEKSPLIYWLMAVSYRVFGVHDWAARLPLALVVVLLCWVTYRFGRWALGAQAGIFSGLVLATSAGLYLFTRILIPDAALTLTITVALWAWMRLLEGGETRPRSWAALLGASLGCGLLLKGLIAAVFPVLTGLAFMAVTGQLFARSAWRRMHLFMVIAIALLVAVPWHLLAMWANPPLFAFSIHSGPGEYRGFFWFYFFNEHILRFLNLRYPRDYNTVPRVLFWALNLVWLFPWSAYLPGVTRLKYGRATRATRLRALALCWIAVVMLFFTFSTTQEYYSMPIYPGMALLIGSAIAEGKWIRTGSLVLRCVFATLCVAMLGVLLAVAHIPSHGELATALAQHPEMYTLSLGHIGDLTLAAFAYLKLPLAVAAVACGLCAIGGWFTRHKIQSTVAVTAVGMILFFQAARIALVRFDPYLGSYPLAMKLLQSPPGTLIEADSYYSFSSVFFYTNRNALLLNGRNNNLEYGSYAPNAPDVFIDDRRFAERWNSAQRYYLLVNDPDLPHIDSLVGHDHLHLVSQSSGKELLCNLP